MHMPVILSVESDVVVVRIRKDQWPVRKGAPQGYCKQQVLIVHYTVVVVVKIGEVLHGDDPPILKHSQIEFVIQPLHLPTKTEIVPSAGPRQPVVKLQTFLPGLLRYTKVGPVGDAREINLDAA